MDRYVLGSGNAISQVSVEDEERVLGVEGGRGQLVHAGPVAAQRLPLRRRQHLFHLVYLVLGKGAPKVFINNNNGDIDILVIKRSHALPTVIYLRYFLPYNFYCPK